MIHFNNVQYERSFQSNSAQNALERSKFISNVLLWMMDAVLSSVLCLIVLGFVVYFVFFKPANVQNVQDFPSKYPQDKDKVLTVQKCVCLL